MRASIRLGACTVPMLAALVTVAVGTRSVAATPRYSARASVSVAASARTHAIGVDRYRVSARLAAPAVRATHASAGFHLTGVLNAAPLGCSDDTIFRNGFEV